MNMLKLTAISIAVSILAGCTPAAETRRLPSYMSSEQFEVRFRSSHYLHIAAEMQSLPVIERYNRLKQLANDPLQGSEAFIFCRMLFEAKSSEPLRAPYIGGPLFIGQQSLFDTGLEARWPLHPIAIVDEMPILVTRIYQTGGSGGLPESPDAYLEYCSSNGVWRTKRYSEMSLSRRREIIQSFVKSVDGLTKEDTDWLLTQGEHE